MQTIEIDQHIHRLTRFEMAAFEQERDMVLLVKFNGRLVHLGERIHVAPRIAAASSRFGVIRSARGNNRDLYRSGGGMNQRITRGCDHDRIDDEERSFVVGKRLIHFTDQVDNIRAVHIPVFIVATGKWVRLSSS